MQYRLEAKTRKWYKAVFFSLVKFATVNSWVYFKILKKCPSVKQYNFVKELCKQIVKKHATQPPSEAPTQRRIRCEIFFFLFLNSDRRHLPKLMDHSKNCALCRKKGKKSKTKFKCIKCNEFVHPKCFEMYHK